MSTEAARRDDFSPFEQLSYARRIVRMEAQALESVADRIGIEFTCAVDLVVGCRGSVVVTGMGKAGLIAQKVSATLASTGTRSFYLHPAEAMHGDLGRLRDDDVVLILSQSGETDEIVRLLPSLFKLAVPIVAVTARRTSTLGRGATVVLELGALQEACSLGLAPSSSTTALLAVGDALALVAARVVGFQRSDFARVHPAGALGRRLSRVDDRMRPPAECRIAPERLSVREVFARQSRPGRRSGAIMLTNDAGELVGLFTDSDLARLLETRRDGELDRPVSELMNRRPTTVPAGSSLSDAVAIMADRRFSELPVVDPFGKPVGMLDVTDLVELIPDEPR